MGLAPVCHSALDAESSFCVIARRPVMADVAIYFCHLDTKPRGLFKQHPTKSASYFFICIIVRFMLLLDIDMLVYTGF